MKQILFLFLFLFSIHLQAQLTPQQEHVVDSLKSITNSAEHDTVKIDAFKAWDNIIYISDPKLDEELNQKIVEIAKKNIQNKSLTAIEKITFNRAMALAFNSLGIIYYNKGENEKAINYYSRSLKIREIIDDKKGIAATLNNLGIIYQDQAENDSAIGCYTRSLKLNEEVGDKNGEANCLSNIGRIFFEQQELDKAIEYQIRSLKIREAIGDKRGIAIAYSGVGSIYFEQNNVERALECFKNALEISEEIGDNNKIALAFANIGSVYKKRFDYSNALIYFNKSIAIFEEIGNKKWEASLHIYIGDIYNQQGENKNALVQYLKALEIGKSSGITGIIRDASQSLYNSYKALKDYKEAMGMYEQYIQMRDSVLSEKNQKEIIKQELKYGFEKDKAIAEKEHEKEKAVAAEREKSQNIIIYAIAGCLLLLIVFTVFVFNRLYFTRKQKAVIEKQKNLVEEKQKEVMASITYAKRLQEAILPTDSYFKSQLPNSFILYKPKDIVAGDFYWMERKGDFVFVAAADCTGHGVPGAMVSVICSNALNRAVIEFGITEPGKILDKTRELVLDTFSRSNQDVKDGMDISLLCINVKYNQVKWSGSNTPLWYISNGILMEIKANKQAIGKTDNPLPFTTHNITFNKGDLFYLFTDGYADQFGGPKGKKIKSKNLKIMLFQNHNLPPLEQKNKLEQSFQTWKGALEQIDDVSLIGIKL
jgi:tetratricopeptide (TPR) repeat protein